MSCADRSAKKEGKYHYTDPAKVPEDTQCIIVLGGDGNTSAGCRDVVHIDIPLLGINLGTLGFLAEVDNNSLYIRHWTSAGG